MQNKKQLFDPDLLGLKNYSGIELSNRGWQNPFLYPYRKKDILKIPFETDLYFNRYLLLEAEILQQVADVKSKFKKMNPIKICNECKLTSEEIKQFSDFKNADQQTIDKLREFIYQLSMILYKVHNNETA